MRQRHLAAWLFGGQKWYGISQLVGSGGFARLIGLVLPTSGDFFGGLLSVGFLKNKSIYRFFWVFELTF